MLKLRPYKPTDSAHVVGWITNEEAFRLWCADRFENYPLSPEEFNKMYENKPNDLFGMIAEDNGDIIGHFFVQKLQQDRYKFGLIIVDNTKRGKGYGKRMLLTAFNYAKTTLKAKSITLSVFDTNEAAYKCYLNLGFKETGNYITHTFFGKEHKYIELEYTPAFFKEESLAKNLASRVCTSPMSPTPGDLSAKLTERTFKERM